MGKRVYIEQSSSNYRKMFASMGWVPVPDVRTADLVCFTGGEDVLPFLYGHQPLAPVHSYNHARDIQCTQLYRQALLLNKPMVGICRGGQFLNVANGGQMYQDVRGHAGRDHNLLMKHKDVVIEVGRASSTHHQMMIPAPNGELIGTCSGTPGHRHTWWDVEQEKFRQKDCFVDNEVVFYEGTRSLCFQPHPEFPGYGGLTEAFFQIMALTILAP